MYYVPGFVSATVSYHSNRLILLHAPYSTHLHNPMPVHNPRPECHHGLTALCLVAPQYIEDLLQLVTAAVVVAGKAPQAYLHGSRHNG